MNTGACVHLETLYGENSHHIAESGFKALARAVRQAVEIDVATGGAAASTKGML
jgi:imidazoleglycerol-phosphate dehydratase